MHDRLHERRRQRKPLLSKGRTPDAGYTPVRSVISTNNIARGMVRGSQIRFQFTQNTLSSGFRKITDTATAQPKNDSHEVDSIYL
jgi:hypothetical protein